MSTGARTDQIEAAARAMFAAEKARHGWLHSFEAAGPWRIKAVEQYASYLVPPGSAIIDAEDVAAIRRAAEFIHAFNTVDTMEDASLAQYYATFVTSADLDRLRRIGGEG